MQDANHCSSTPHNSTPKSPANAFQPEFLHKLEAREDAPLAGLEAENRGPWRVVELAAAGGGGGDDDGQGGRRADAPRWAVLRAWEKPGQAEPAGRFLYREHALLCAAALEVASRGSDLGVGLTRDDHGQVIVQWTGEQGAQTIGHLAVWDEGVAAALRFLETLLRVPEALARLVDAGGAPIAELLGRRLVAEE